MLGKKGKGTTLEDLGKFKGRIIGLCGTNDCSVSRTGNREKLDFHYSERESSGL